MVKTGEKGKNRWRERKIGDLELPENRRANNTEPRPIKFPFGPRREIGQASRSQCLANLLLEMTSAKPAKGLGGMLTFRSCS